MPSKSKSKKSKVGQLLSNVVSGPSSQSTASANSGQKRPRSPTADPEESNKRIEVDSSEYCPIRFDPRKESPAAFDYKGNDYTIFQFWEYGCLDALLFMGKHSISRLRDAGCFILDDPDPFDVSLSGYKKEDYISMPAYEHSPSKHRHVVIDCSFVECEGGGVLEIAHLSVLSLADGEELISSYVWPKAPVTKWDEDLADPTISERDLEDASVTDSVYVGWKAARKGLAEFVDSETVMVGEHVCGILRALRISHKNVFDLKIARSDSSMTNSVLQDTPYSHRRGRSCGRRATPGEDGRLDYFEKALKLRERAIRCLKQPWEARLV